MEISAKELRGSPGKYIRQAARGTDVVVTLRGKRVARLVPYVENAETVAEGAEYAPKDEIFGMWADHIDTADVDTYVRLLRQGRRS